MTSLPFPLTSTSSSVHRAVDLCDGDDDPLPPSPFPPAPPAGGTGLLWWLYVDHRLYGNQTVAVDGGEEEGALPSWDSGRGLLVSAAAASVFTVGGRGLVYRVLEKEGSPSLSPHHHFPPLHYFTQPPPLLSTPPTSPPLPSPHCPCSSLPVLLLFFLSLFRLHLPLCPSPHPPPGDPAPADVLHEEACGPDSGAVPCGRKGLPAPPSAQPAALHHLSAAAALLALLAAGAALPGDQR